MLEAYSPCLQEIPHVHFHVIPKPAVSDEEGLVIGWPTKKVEKDELAKVYEEIKARLEKVSVASPL
jgi:diadenosine tetraphosphate (Ap4A) HIT family hydrolase